MEPVASFLWLQSPTVLAVLDDPMTNFWLGINVLLDTGLGVGFFIGLVYLQPHAFDGAWTRYQKAKQLGKERREFLATLPKDIDLKTRRKLLMQKFGQKSEFLLIMKNLVGVNLWLVYSLLTIVVWFGVVGILMALLLSKGLVNPLTTYLFNGISYPGWFYDLLFARANAQPNGAHIWSYVMVPVFVLIVAYKLRPKNLGGAFKVIGDIYQGAGAGTFLVAIHEGLWLVFYYTVYAVFLSSADINNVLRDVSFCVMIALFIAAYWKYPKRTIPMKTFLYPTLIYLAFLCGWLIVPHLLVNVPPVVCNGLQDTGATINWLPITTINNPSCSVNIYQATGWFPNPYVNGIEVASWLLLGISYSIAVSRLKPEDLLPIKPNPPFIPKWLRNLRKPRQ